MTATEMQARRTFVHKITDKTSEVDWMRVGVKTFWFSLAVFWVAEAALFFSMMSWASLFGLVYLGIAGGCMVFGLAA
jgi:hypothetical protein